VKITIIKRNTNFIIEFFVYTKRDLNILVGFIKSLCFAFLEHNHPLTVKLIFTDLVQESRLRPSHTARTLLERSEKIHHLSLPFTRSWLPLRQRRRHSATPYRFKVPSTAPKVLSCTKYCER
jgi:hypothetical protein